MTGWQRCAVLLGLLGTTGIGAAEAVQPIAIRMAAEGWHVVGDRESGGKQDVQFIGHEGFPEGAVVIKAGAVVLNNFRFRDGTIEYDMKGIGEDIPGIQFRKPGAGGKQDAEEFYVRTFPECRASNDCIQYAPEIHGSMLWNSYPQYQTQAFILDGWNHFRLVIHGSRMNVYINRQPAPALVVGKLESDAAEGTIELRGPAVFANLVVTPGATEGLPAQPTPDPTVADAAIVRHWQLGPETPAHYGTAPRYAELRGDAKTWPSVTAERFGLLNLNRDFTAGDTPPSLLWLRTTVVSDRDQQKHVSLGWLGEVSVFVNGTLVTRGKNYYYPEGERRNPDGRLSLENGSFDIPLKQGSNEIVLALREAVHDSATTANPYGLGVEMRYSNLRGIRQGK